MSIQALPQIQSAPTQLAPVPGPPQAVPAQQPPTENPLDQLKDIHLPDQVDQFPSAPGWWLLLAIILMAVGYFIYRRVQYQKAIRLLKPANAELSELKALSPDVLDARSIATLSALLKRICLVYFPQLEVASLSGQNWLKFLNQQKTINSTEMVFFSPQNIQLFCETPYQKNPSISANDWNSLINASESCIRQIIIGSAKTKIKNKKRGVKL